MTIKTEDAELLMKKLQRGVGARGALDRALEEANNIMAECYGTIGSLVQERDRLYIENRVMREAVTAMVEDGYLHCGPEGMTEAQALCYQAYLLVSPSVIVRGPNLEQLKYIEAYLEGAVDDEESTGLLMSAKHLLEDVRKFICSEEIKKIPSHS